MKLKDFYTYTFHLLGLVCSSISCLAMVVGIIIVAAISNAYSIFDPFSLYVVLTIGIILLLLLVIVECVNLFRLNSVKNSAHQIKPCIVKGTKLRWPMETVVIEVDGIEHLVSPWQLLWTYSFHVFRHGQQPKRCVEYKGKFYLLVEED